MYLIFLIVCVVAVKHGQGQSYNQIHHQNPYQMGGQYSASPYRDYPFSPFSGSSGGVNQNGRMEMMKASNFPSQYYDNHGSPSTAALTLSSTPLQPSSFYSGFYHMQDKPSRGPHQQPYHSPSSPFISNLFSQMPAGSTQSSLSSAMTPAHLHSVVVHQPQFQQHSVQQPVSPSYSIPSQPVYVSRLPGFPSSSPSSGAASMNTYQEALDLFSEVVHKLEEQPSPGSNSFGHNLHPSPMMSNGIYGSSLPSPGSTPGFPRHLDHIMGPDFLQRAQKLYTKIIKEQNERLMVTPQPQPSPIIPSQKYSLYHPSSGSRNSIHYGFEHGAPQYKSLLHSGPPIPTYTRPSYLARNMNLDPFVQYPHMEAVKSIEIPMGRRDDGESDEMMQMAESVQRPLISRNQVSLKLSSPPNLLYRPATPPPSMTPTTPKPSSSPPPPPTSPASEIQKSYEEETASIPLSSLDFPRSIPISENDFVEHPLPYEEYEGLVRDIAINHNY